METGNRPNQHYKQCCPWPFRLRCKRDSSEPQRPRKGKTSQPVADGMKKFCAPTHPTVAQEAPQKEGDTHGRTCAPSQMAARQHRAEPPRKVGDLQQYARSTVNRMGSEIKPHLGGHGANSQSSAVCQWKQRTALTNTIISVAPGRFVCDAIS